MSTTSVLKMQRELVAVTEERDLLAEELQKLREQKPVAWVDYIEHGDGSVTHNYAKEPGATYARPLYAAPVAVPVPAPSVPEEWREKLLAGFPLRDEEGLCQEKHHCEWTLLQDRKRLHALLQSAEVRHD